MKFEPAKFYISVLDFFAILLPGSLAVIWLLSTFNEESFFDSSEFNFIALFSASYIVGHVLYMIGSITLDNWIYNPIRNQTSYTQYKTLAGLTQDENPLVRFIRNASTWKSDWLFKGKQDVSLAMAIALKNREMSNVNDPDCINAYQWCKLRLEEKFPEALEPIEKLETDSKLFRSLIILTFCMLVFSTSSYVTSSELNFRVLQSQPFAMEIGILLFLFIIFMYRFFKLRAKSVCKAYWAVLYKSDFKLEESMEPFEIKYVVDGVKHRWEVNPQDKSFRYLSIESDARKLKDFGGLSKQELAIKIAHEQLGHWTRVKTSSNRYTPSLNVNLRFYGNDFLKRSALKRLLKRSINESSTHEKPNKIDATAPSNT